METLILGLTAGTLVGLVLGLIGGGGSILAVPMLIYVVGVTSPHVAIGTSAVAVAASAAINLVLHARQGTVKWRCATLFALVGAIAAWAGATLGKATNGQSLLALFGAVMIAVGLLMLRPRSEGDNPNVRLDRQSVTILGPRLAATGVATGFASGYFGIGGGFLIVPSLLFATNMPMIAAVGSSLLAVAAFGATTALSYSSSGLVAWPLAGIFVAGGVVGGTIGTRLAKVLGRRRRVLTVSFGVLVAGVGTYIFLNGLPALAHRLGNHKEETMSYYIAKTVNEPFDTVVAEVTARLKEQGFGVLTDIDVQSTLKAKIGVDMPKYRILGACNPRFAHGGLQIEDKLGVLLPCNVIVRETPDRKVEVASVDPVAAMERTGNPTLQSTAEEVRRALTQVVAQLGA